MPCTNHPSHHPSDACTHPCSPHSQMHPNLKCKPCMSRMYYMRNSMLLCTGSASYTEDMAIEDSAAVVLRLLNGLASPAETHQCLLVCGNELPGLPLGPRSIQRRMVPIRNEVDLGFHSFQLVVLLYQDLANAWRYELVFVLSDGRVSCCTCFIELRLQPDERYGALHVRSCTAWADHLLIGVIADIVVVFV